MNRAERFSYLGLVADGDTLRGHYRLDDIDFVEEVTVDGADLTNAAQRSIAELWYLIAGLSYYKAGAARVIDFGDVPVGDAGRTLVEAAVIDGLGEYRFRNDLPLEDVTFEGGAPVDVAPVSADPSNVLIPFGGGIDSCVTVAALAHCPRTLFVVSPASGTFAPLEATAAVTGLPMQRVTRHLDLATLTSRPFFNGHVPVTTMVTLLAVLSALANGQGSVAMSNEHSSSAPNLTWRGRTINHQWSKSERAETLIAEAVAERIGSAFVVASYLRDRSELWVAQQFAQNTALLPVFRSCNRAFAQDQAKRATQWCGECDKCLFINLVLAPFLSRDTLRDIFGSEPLTNPTLAGSLAALVGVGLDNKPFECVGDPDESAAALVEIAARPEWHDVPALAHLAAQVHPERSFQQLLEPQRGSRVPAAWLR